MARIGSNVRPELGRIDYSPIARGGEALGAGINRGMLSIGQGIQRAIQEKKMKEEKKKQTDAAIDMYQKYFGATPDDAKTAVDAAGPNNVSGLIFTMEKMKEQAKLEQMINVQNNIKFGQIISSNTNDDGSLNLSQALADLDKHNAPESAYEELRMYSKEVKTKEEDFGMESFKSYVNMDTGDVAQFGFREDNGQLGRVKNGTFEEKSDDWVLMDAVTASSPSPENFDKKRDEMLAIDESIRKVDSLMASRGMAGSGIEYIKNRTSGLAKTLLGGRSKLTEEEKAAELASDRFQSAIGQFRVETVGPGIVTEFDAKRIEAAIGRGLVAGNFDVVSELMTKIREEKKRKATMLRQQLNDARASNPMLRGDYFVLPDEYAPTQHEQPAIGANHKIVDGKIVPIGQ